VTLATTLLLPATVGPPCFVDRFICRGAQNNLIIYLSNVRPCRGPHKVCILVELAHSAGSAQGLLPCIHPILHQPSLHLDGDEPLPLDPRPLCHPLEVEQGLPRAMLLLHIKRIANDSRIWSNPC